MHPRPRLRHEGAQTQSLVEKVGHFLFAFKNAFGDFGADERLYVRIVAVPKVIAGAFGFNGPRRARREGICVDGEHVCARRLFRVKNLTRADKTVPRLFALLSRKRFDVFDKTKEVFVFLPNHPGICISSSAFGKRTVPRAEGFELMYNALQQVYR
jgi:hypothetical protein